ncbi:MAG: 50S ribosomal protein L25 [Planctomycetaceae bacterium]|nr:50S ribosomal protein L25 [Planctomycetales bacterium]MCB9872768.1 50S ribosomal protein L25 [Planctomycetaceae bacterium]MCB9926254.1 50S ribosomal protein L25 [Planctomycetaceae bacterium]
MADTLNVSVREQLGTNHTRRLRRSGHVPAILYGHGEKNVNLSIAASEVSSAIRHGAKVVDIRGAVSDSALIRDVQWDALGSTVIHVDLTRVSADEKVEVTVQVELRGEAPGAREGGVVEHVTHEVEIECAVNALPDKLVVSINDLHLNQSITAAQLELPGGAVLLSDAEAVIVHVVEPVEQSDEAEVPGAEGAEPEVIGGRPDEEDEKDD